MMLAAGEGSHILVRAAGGCSEPWMNQKLVNEKFGED